MSPETEYDPNAEAESNHGQPDLEALYDQGVDQDAVDRVEADALLPGGTYQSVPVLLATPFVTKTGPNAGRQGFRVYGEFVSTKPLSRGNGVEPQIITGRLGFGMSPERRDTERGPDTQSRLWANAVRAYTLASGQKPQTNRDVVEFVKNYPFGVRVGQVGVATARNPEPTGDPGNMVFSLFPIRG